MNDDTAIAMGEQLERIAVALEQIVAYVKPSDLAAFNAEAPRTAPEPRQATSGPVDPEPPFPGPSPEFRQSRDLPAEPVLPPAPVLPLEWTCPRHHKVKIVPAGISKAGKAYPAFLACPEQLDGGQYCQEKPPQTGPRR